MQCARAILSSVACPTLQYFSTLSHKRHDLGEKVIEHKTCVLIFSTATFIILRSTQQDIFINVHSLHVKYPFSVSDFNGTWIFSTHFRKILKYQNPYSGSRVVGGARTDKHDEVNSRFSQFCECAWNWESRAIN